MTDVADLDLTPPLHLGPGDRVALERRLDTIQRVTEAHLSERAGEATRFFTVLDASMARLRSVAWFALGMATASLVVQLIRIVAVILAADK